MLLACAVKAAIASVLAGRGLTGAALKGKPYSQPDARALQSLVSFGNVLPVVMLSNSLMAWLPKQNTHPINDN